MILSIYNYMYIVYTPYRRGAKQVGQKRNNDSYTLSYCFNIFVCLLPPLSVCLPYLPNLHTYIIIYIYTTTPHPITEPRSLTETLTELKPIPQSPLILSLYLAWSCSWILLCRRAQPPYKAWSQISTATSGGGAGTNDQAMTSLKVSVPRSVAAVLVRVSSWTAIIGACSARSLCCAGHGLPCMGRRMDWMNPRRSVLLSITLTSNNHFTLQIQHFQKL